MIVHSVHAHKTIMDKRNHWEDPRRNTNYMFAQVSNTIARCKCCDVVAKIKHIVLGFFDPVHILILQYI